MDTRDNCCCINLCICKVYCFCFKPEARLVQSFVLHVSCSKEKIATCPYKFLLYYKQRAEGKESKSHVRAHCYKGINPK